MKTIASAVAISMLLLQGCAAINPGKFNLGLEQRQNAITGAQTNGMTPKLTYTATFGGDSQKAKAQDEMAMKMDGKDTAETAIIIGLIALAVASKKSDTTPAKKPICNTTTLPFPPYISTVCN
ncbi:MAG: hypothetical protein EBT02_10940 [Planctomycetia bacterium]|nr:hypothetical protein [Planctomycetia bacterium]